MTKSPLSLGELVKEAMLRNGLTASTLAKAIGTSEGTVRNVLRAKQGQISVSPDVLRKIANQLDLSEIEVFQHAGYLSRNTRKPNLSNRSRLFAARYDQLPNALQDVLWDILRSFEQRVVAQNLETSLETTEPDPDTEISNEEE